MSDLHIAPTGGDSLLGGGEERSTRDSAIVLVNLIGVCLAFTVVLLPYSSVQVTDAITTDSNE